ncbi:hypothetical protein KP509_31G034900 [Ceratopteris richardii]|nr:hypothetical protein KP509_31G034900 [Ceratopteris richardii]
MVSSSDSISHLPASAQAWHHRRKIISQLRTHNQLYIHIFT